MISTDVWGADMFSERYDLSLSMNVDKKKVLNILFQSP